MKLRLKEEGLIEGLELKSAFYHEVLGELPYSVIGYNSDRRMLLELVTLEGFTNSLLLRRYKFSSPEVRPINFLLIVSTRRLARGYVLT